MPAGDQTNDARARRDALRTLAAIALLIAALLAALSLLRGPAPPEVAPGARIDINTADAATLEILPGVGPAIAARIVEERARAGPFTSPEDLTRVRGVGERTIRRLAPLIIARPPGEVDQGP